MPQEASGVPPTGDPATRDRPSAVSGEGVVPLVECCPGCATPVSGHKCKVYCPNPQCALYRRIIENCAGD
jgi:hypothetical protein